jgi:uncharacterized membrane protein YgaE (UPF0421/DUF939 family)
LCYISTSWVGLHEGYWAAISAIVVMQADLTATRNSGRDRFLGTALGAVLGWGCATLWHGHVWAYALTVAASVFLFRFLEVSWGIAVGVALGSFEAWLARRGPKRKG